MTAEQISYRTKQRVYKQLAKAILSTVAQDNELDFFAKKGINYINPMADICLGLSGITEEKVRLEAERYQKRRELRRAKRLEDHQKMYADVFPYFNGKLTINEIAEKTGRDAQSLRYLAWLHDLSYVKKSGVNLRRENRCLGLSKKL